MTENPTLKTLESLLEKINLVIKIAREYKESCTSHPMSSTQKKNAKKELIVALCVLMKDEAYSIAQDQVSGPGELRIQDVDGLDAFINNIDKNLNAANFEHEDWIKIRVRHDVDFGIHGWGPFLTFYREVYKCEEKIKQNIERHKEYIEIVDWQRLNNKPIGKPEGCPADESLLQCIDERIEAKRREDERYEDGLRKKRRIEQKVDKEFETEEPQTGSAHGGETDTATRPVEGQQVAATVGGDGTGNNGTGAIDATRDDAAKWREEGAKKNHENAIERHKKYANYFNGLISDGETKKVAYIRTVEKFGVNQSTVFRAVNRK